MLNLSKCTDSSRRKVEVEAEHVGKYVGIKSKQSLLELGMSQVGKILSQTCRKLHTLFCHGPGESLKKRVVEMEKRRKQRNPRKNQLFIEVLESKSFLDTATMPMILTVVGTAIFAKILMMVDESRSQQMIERKIKNAPPGQGTVRMLSSEEWKEIREIRPRTPFESKLARPNARIRTGEHLRWVILNSLTRSLGGFDEIGFKTVVNEAVALLEAVYDQRNLLVWD